ncbi:MAG: hypothetical protein ACP5G4_10255, partial [bacterium]
TARLGRKAAALWTKPPRNPINHVEEPALHVEDLTNHIEDFIIHIEETINHVEEAKTMLRRP